MSTKSSISNLLKASRVRTALKIAGAILLIFVGLQLFTIPYSSEKLPTSKDEAGDKEEKVQVIHSFYPDEGKYSEHLEKITKVLIEDNKFLYSKIIYTDNHNHVDRGNDDTVLFLVSVGNEKSFGGHRTIKDLIDVITSFDYPQYMMSVGILCGSQKVLDDATEFFDELKEDELKFRFKKVTLLQESFMGESFGRHDDRDEVQRERRRMIARSRNFVLFHSLDNERYTVFIDADISRIDHHNMLKLFIKLDLDIINPRIVKGGDGNYDRNAWTGIRTRPSKEQVDLMRLGKWSEANWTPGNDKIRHLSDMIPLAEVAKDAPERELDYAVELDSVGGAILFAKAIVYKQGVNFPPMYAVGTDWDLLEGYDGIETEGTCYIAKTLGYKCWAMPNLIGQHYV